MKQVSVRQYVAQTQDDGY